MSGLGCRKGNRDCVYPEPSTTSKSSRSSAKAKDSSQESGESGDDAEHDEKGALESIPDEEDSPGQEPPEYQRASEYLGDWVNLLGHQRAAYEVLTSLYTPQTIMQNETLRKILQWYIRFDLYASVIAGCGTILGREWVAAAYEYYAQQAVEKPNDIEYKYEERIFRSRLLATDIAILFSRRARATIDNDSFAIECDNLRRQFDMYEVQIDPALRDPSKLVTSFSGSPLRDPCDAVSPASSETLYGDNLFSTNFLLVDFWAMDLMLRHHLLTAGLMEPAEAAGLTAKALKVYNMFEAIERYPHSPPGAVVATQASLNVASFFLPRDDKYNMWMRRSLAKVESLG
ncbi:hypothetical protein H2201_000231 [Coniosporium apollinis]|uniref:Uncharacterized protein n=1 Tax=Coniosporium apollinis TaxID=61459 RepID=A0ABQ9P5R2_9PEZI|nr:hypothetical protein H2201_000231 [Coniosporium apollinis]